SEENKASLTTKGAYVLADANSQQPDVILMGSGSEVHLAMGARQKLKEEGIAARVVSMPSWELYRAQDQAYRQQVLPEEVTARVSIEAAATFGWSEWIGQEGTAIGVDHFGASAPYKEIFEKFDITAGRMAEEA